MFKQNNILGKALAKLKLMEQQLVEESQVLGELKEKEDADVCEFEALQSELEARKKDISLLSEGLRKRNSEMEISEAALKKSSEEFRLLMEKNKVQLLRLDEAGAANQRLLASLAEMEERGRVEVKAAKAEAACKEALAAALKEELEKQVKENERLSLEFISKAAEFKAALDKERTDFRFNYEKICSGAAQTEKGLLSEIEALKETLWQRDTEAARANARIKTLTEKNEALTEDYEGRFFKVDGLNASLREDVKRKKTDIETLSNEVRSQSSEFTLLLDRERAEAKSAQIKAQNDLRELTETVKRICAEANKLGLELEAIKEDHAAIKAHRDSSLVKIAELEIFSKSAISALKEKEWEIKVLKDRMEDISNDLSKNRPTP